MFFVIQCTDRPECAQSRNALLSRHKTYLEEHRRLSIWAGARQQDDGETVYGSFYPLNVPDRAPAEAFIYNEPFCLGGLFDQVVLSNVRRGIFHPDLAS